MRNQWLWIYFEINRKKYLELREVEHHVMCTPPVNRGGGTKPAPLERADYAG